MTVDSKIRTVQEQIVVEEKVVQLEKLGTDPDFKREIVWKNVIGFIYLHVAAFYGLYLALTSAKIWTNLWSFFILVASAQGVLMGAHRLYSHKAYKASWQLRLILNILQTVAGQNCMYIWVRDHRQHHKYSDTDADPHNAIRGFFFSHMGWLMSRKHPKVIEKGKGIDMSDLEADGIVMFQKKYYKTLYLLFAIMIPTLAPYFFWKEDIWNSLFVAYFFRYVFLLHGTWTVNSFAHIYGNRPYDKDIVPVENYAIAKLTMGEGWHNYHHAFPYDYRAAEFGYRDASLTTQLIDLMASIGWAKDLRTASDDMVVRRTFRKGDGTHKVLAKNPLAQENGGKNDSIYRKKISPDLFQDLDKFMNNNVTTVEDAYTKIASENLKEKTKLKAFENLNLRNNIVNQG
ncbi:acyl-CoA Delta-9 desaturase-like [Ischnura elegans]|uniref:acyl-CoA Delta-9 desaturase-like n=1 Tax=Ischnura elegans TaxID=197161 RepID=UPI001ED867D2|nr:acyl-CoA Delta-9 desaturase-like [Ischnura elegans]